ncbi:hypothetical protein MVEN_02274200 [Mycena venus]|uniref:F-box domain-containing protein n=1 Tax=Mycena venus TaxID=2733690 RepID=A0A8H6X5D2_9AGAR|nr:hypothetical protein MVEN_02274200 [Mycena venus]
MDEWEILHLAKEEDGCIDGVHDRGSQFLAAVLQHYARWEYIKLHFDTVDFRGVPGTMSLLRHLDLSLSDPPDFVSFGDLPLLRTAILNDVAAIYLTFPWTQLISLTLTSIHLHECVPILPQASNLVYCELELFFVNYSDREPFTLPYVEDFMLKDACVTFKFNITTPVNILENFILPALCRLEIPERFFGDDPIDCLASFISHSGCALQDVCITGKRYILKNVYRTAFPSIQFFFDGVYDGDEVEGADL